MPSFLTIINKVTYYIIAYFQPCDKVAVLLDKTIKFFFTELAWNQSLVPSGEKLFCFRPPAWPLWRQLKTRDM